MDDSEWQPPSAEELKVIEARRARSDQVSKLMASYLLKGYKMLGLECSTCGTILLQDRSNTKHCVACEELESDTDKDNPALRPLGVSNHNAAIVKQELEEATPETSSVVMSTAASVAPSHHLKSYAGIPQARGVTPRSGPGTPRVVAIDESGGAGDFLSMSSIDVHCWPANPPPVTDASSGGDSGINIQTDSLSSQVRDASQLCGTILSSKSKSPIQQPSLGNGDISTCISILQQKILTASAALEHTQSVSSSIELCKLISAAADAIVAVRKASL